MPSKHSISYLETYCEPCHPRTLIGKAVPVCGYLDLELWRFLLAIDYGPVARGGL